MYLIPVQNYGQPSSNLLTLTGIHFLQGGHFVFTIRFLCHRSIKLMENIPRITFPRERANIVTYVGFACISTPEAFFFCFYEVFKDETIFSGAFGNRTRCLQLLMRKQISYQGDKRIKIKIFSSAKYHLCIYLWRILFSHRKREHC